jgi:drug/metabolite transporter (DMT)-like permease
LKQAPEGTETALTQKARGILLIIAAVSCFGAVDGFSKILVDTQSFGQIMLARYVPALAVLLIATGPQQWKGLFATRRMGLQIFRGLTPVFVGGLMVFAVRYLPLAQATVILFAGPFLVVALSGWMLGERVDASSWIGVAIGFLAVLLVARPGLDALSTYTIFPALAAVFYALLQLLSRRLGAVGESPGTTLAWTLLVGSVVSLPVAVIEWRTPSLSDWFFFFCLAASFGWGQHFLARAFALAPANVLTPFSYFQILSAALFGVVILHDMPDTWTLSGIVLILVAGAYVFGRNRQPEADARDAPP